LSLFGTGRKEGILAVLLLVALALLQHAPGAILGRHRAALDPSGPSGGGAVTAGVDATSEAATNQTVLLPALRQAGAVARAGSVPTWNPHARFGEPFPVSGAPLWYPPYWPLLLDGGSAFLDWVMLLHSALACVLAYRMLRALSVSRYAAFLGAGLYGLGWFFTTALDRLPEAAAAAWLPWIVTRSWRTLFAPGSLPAAAALGLSITVPFLTGGIATAMLGVGLAVVCIAAGLLAIDRGDRRGAAASLSGALGLATLCTAPLWLPALALAPVVADPPHAGVARLQPAGLLALVAPGLFGELGGPAPDGLRQLNPGADSLELALYPGALVLLVALMGLLRPKRTRLALFWLLVAGGSLVLALDGPLAGLWHDAAPLLLRRPGAILAIFHLATVVLLALGLENFFDAPRARPFALPLAACTALLLCAATAAGLFVVPDLGAAALRSITGPLDPAALAAALARVRDALAIPLIALTLLALSFLLWRRIGILRFKQAVACIALGELCVLALLHAPRAADDPTAGGFAAMLPNAAVRTMRVGSERLPGGWLAGHDGSRAIDTDGDQILGRTARYLESIEPGLVRIHSRVHVGPLQRPAAVDDPRLASAGLGLVVTTRPLPLGRFVPLAAAPGVDGAAVRTGQPYAALDEIPRLRLAFSAELAEGPADAERALAARGLPFRLDRVIVESAPAEFTCVRPSTEAELAVVEERPDLLRVAVDVRDGRGYLVVAEAHAPGWQATVDGHPTPVLPADLGFRAVPLREGAHEVVLRYQAPGLALGLALGVLGVLISAGMLLARSR
jgi:hypothetical protein